MQELKRNIINFIYFFQLFVDIKKVKIDYCALYLTLLF